MIKITKSDTTIMLREHPNWVQVLENGVFGLCTADSAQGIAIDGAVYHLPGYDIGGGGVTFETVDSGAYLQEQTVQTEQTLTDLDIANIEAQQAITDLELMFLEG